MRGGARSTARDQRIVGAIVAWFEAEARALPWRTSPREPYKALVSEAMLQQTQASRVAERFGAFVERFPDVESLAAADEQDVLALWSGLGYYRRARHLHRAARMIVERFSGRVPCEVDELLTLPGVGRYTAGAISSIAYGRTAAIVDGNVTRVLMRIEGQGPAPDSQEGRAWVWARAEGLVRTAGARRAAGAFNEGLMELGAVVCTPRGPRCESCPVGRVCVARREGMQDRIPPARRRASRSVTHHASVVVRDGRGKLLVQRRGDDGMWAGLWQAPTIEREDRAASTRELRSLLGKMLGEGVRGARLRRRCAFEHRTTHRDVRFVVYDARVVGVSEAVSESTQGLAGVSGAPGAPGIPGAEWRSAVELASMGLASPHRRVLLGEGG